MKSLKFFIRKLKYNHKRTFLFGLFFLLFIGVSVGYAFLTTTLNITGALNIAESKWDIYFENIEIEGGSVEATTSPTITDNTSISFSTTLNNPGEQYQFTVDLVNDGTYDAKLDSIEVTPTLTEEQQEYFNYLVEYTEGGNIQVNDALDAGTSESIKVLVQYKENDDDSKYPGEDIEFNFSVTMNYIQGKGNEVHHTSLYSVLKDAAIEGTYAKEYTGEHHDSFTKEPSKKIYHWNAPNNNSGNTLANEILDKNNVIFANHCWQMIRTTDTGGLKMIYNGEEEDGKCLNTRANHVGYIARTAQSLSTAYYYGTDYIFDKNNNVFSLSGTTSTGEIKVGEYTCKSTTVDGTCTTLYLVDTLISETTYYVFSLNGNSHYSQFGTLPFNQTNSSIADVGYMYNTRYSSNDMLMTFSEYMFSTDNLSIRYWYANSITSLTSPSGYYSLNNSYQVSSTSDYSNLVGEYTFRNVTQTYTNSTIYYIANVKDSVMYYIPLYSGNNLSYYNYSYTYGDSYINNGDGTYTINSPTTIRRSDYYSHYSSMKNKYVCKNAVDDTCSDLWYITMTSDTTMTYIKVKSIKYAKGFTYDEDTETYRLNDESVSFWNIKDSTNQTSINNAHYTCWNASGTCKNLYYIYSLSDSSSTGIHAYYLKLTNGKDIENVVNEMLYNDDVNLVNSTIKSGVDAWYQHYLIKDYDNYIEDIIFCSDRSQNNKLTNGWNPNGGSVTDPMSFQGTSGLKCSNKTDQFSVSNEHAKLLYKVGLLSALEMKLLTHPTLLSTRQTYWLITPSFLYSSNQLVNNIILFSGSSDGSVVNNSLGVRPAISLKLGTKYSSGDGSMSNPYVVE